MQTIETLRNKSTSKGNKPISEDGNIDFTEDFK